MKLITDEEYLKTEADIKAFFEEEYHDHFDCGQGYYEEQVSLIVMTIDEKFWVVTLIAEIYSAKQDCGDKLYWVESLESVESEEITPKEAQDKINCDIDSIISECQENIKSLEIRRVDFSGYLKYD